MSSEKFIKKKATLVTLVAACLIVIVSLGVRQTFGMFYFDFSTDLGITLSQFGFALGLQMLLWGVFGPWFGVITDKYGGHVAVFIGFVFYLAGILMLYSQYNTGLYFVTAIGVLIGVALGGTAITSTAAELNILDGVTSTAAELNILDGVTATATELNLIDGVTATTAELNILDGVTATAAEINILASGLASGDIPDNAADTTGSAATLTTARTIGGTSFDGSANIAVGLAATATALATARTIGGVSFDGSANINLPGVNAAGSQNTSGTAAKVTVTNSTANTNFPVIFHNESDALLDDTGALRYNPSTGTLLVPNLTVAGTTTQVDTVTMNAANAVVFEGATADAHETTLTIVDPTGDHTQYLINQGGYIPVLAAATTTAITSTPAELNILDGVTATAT